MVSTSKATKHNLDASAQEIVKLRSALGIQTNDFAVEQAILSSHPGKLSAERVESLVGVLITADQPAAAVSASARNPSYLSSTSQST